MTQTLTINTNVSLITEVDGEPMVDSRMIAEMFDRPHKSVLRSLKDLIDDGDITEHEFVPSEYKDSTGRRLPKYLLTEAAALLAMPYLGGRKSKEGQKKLVNEYLDYRAKATQVVKRPETKLEWMREAIAAEEGRLLALQEKEIAEQAQKKAEATVERVKEALEEKEESLLEAAPKVEFFDQVVESDVLYPMADAAKLLEYGPIKFNNLLREKGWLYSRKDKVVPTQAAINKGVLTYKLMSVYRHPSLDCEFENRTAFVTSLGLATLRKLMRNLSREVKTQETFDKVEVKEAARPRRIPSEKLNMARDLVMDGFTQKDAAEAVGVNQSTLCRYLKKFS